MDEHRSSGQIRHVVQVLASTFNGEAFRLNLFEPRMVDVEIADDMLRCRDALRWGNADLYKLVPEGEARRTGGAGASGHQLAGALESAFRSEESI